MIGFYNGEFLPLDLIRVPVFDRGFLFGDGVFTTIRVVDGIIFWLEDHIVRLQASAKIREIPFPNLDSNVFSRLLEKNKCFKGTFKMKLILTEKVCLAFLEKYTLPLKAFRLTVFDQPISSPTARIKTLSYLDRIMIREYGKDKGFDDALTFSPEGFLLESSFANLVWEDSGNIYSPCSSLPLLAGIALGKLQDVQFVKMKLNEIPDSASLYLCNSMHLLHPVEVIDERVFSIGALHQQLAG